MRVIIKGFVVVACLFLLSTPSAWADDTCRADFDYDGQVTLNDGFTMLLEFIEEFGTTDCVPTPVSAVPKTGQPTCYDDTEEITCPQPGDPFYGQDANYQKGSDVVTRLTDNLNGTVTDNLTGLIWEQKTSDNKDYSYTWQEALAYCENLSLAGYDNWRLPNIHELHSIIDYQRVSPAIDSTYFPNAVSSLYWSSTTYVDDAGFALGINFWSGIVDYDGKSWGNYFRAVRGGQ
jgi:hypothetical protein